MSENIIPLQSITLDHEDNCALYVPATEDHPARVFYDLDALLSQFIPTLVTQKVRADLSGDPVEQALVVGGARLMTAIMESKTVLVAEFEMTNVNSLADLGWPED